MRNELQTFISEEFGRVRTFAINGEPWFVARDVAAALGYKNPQKAIRDHVDDEDKGVNEAFTPGGLQRLPVINESGLYSLVLSSKLPTARKFKRWITREVIPAVRKTGAYFTDSVLEQLLADPDQAQMLVIEYARQVAENERLEFELGEALPKARYFDRFVDPAGCTSIRVTAKELRVSEKHLVKYLLGRHYLYRSISGSLMPYAAHIRDGLFVIKDFYRNYGAESGQYTLITARGKKYFLDRVSEIMDETAP